MERKLIVFIAASLDGYIAKPGDDLGFLTLVEAEGEDYGYEKFMSTVDTVIMGRKTYDWILKHSWFPHSEKETFIITRTARPGSGNLTFYSDGLKELVTRLKSEKGKNIFCDGGSEIINQLLDYSLLDELIISVVPVLLGGGVRLFREGIPENRLKFVSVKSYPTGLVQLHYICV